MVRQRDSASPDYLFHRFYDPELGSTPVPRPDLRPHHRAAFVEPLPVRGQQPS